MTYRSRLVRQCLLLVGGVLAIATGASRNANAQPLHEPYDVEEIVAMLRANVAEASIIAAVRAECITFAATSASIGVLSRAGAKPPLLEAIRTACHPATRR